MFNNLYYCYFVKEIYEWLNKKIDFKLMSYISHIFWVIYKNKDNLSIKEEDFLLIESFIQYGTTDQKHICLINVGVQKDFFKFFDNEQYNSCFLYDINEFNYQKAYDISESNSIQKFLLKIFFLF